MLADMGASVLKVEPPAGDPLRRLDPATGQPIPGEGNSGEKIRSPYYDAINAGKTVVAIDLKSDDGKQAFGTLIRSADVLLETYRPERGIGPLRVVRLRSDRPEAAAFRP